MQQSVWGQSAAVEPNQTPRRILQVVAPALVGGLEQVVAALARGLDRRGHDVRVLAVLDQPERDHPFLELFEDTQVGIIPLFLGPRRYRRERAAVRELCLSGRPDVVHTHGYRPDVVDAPVARRMGIPTVTTLHGFTSGGWRNRLYERLQVASARRARAAIAVSTPIAERLEASGVPPDRLHVIRNAWRGGVRHHGREEARQRLGVPLDDFRIGWVGRLSHEKGPDVLLRGLPHLTDLAVSVSFIGDGPHRPRLTALADALGVGDRVMWHGTVSEAASLLSAFDAFVLSSRTEGTPISLLEAIAARVPIIATRVGGVPDVVTPAEAIVVEPEDPPRLADAIRGVYDDGPSALQRASAALQRLNERFAVEPWLQAHEDVYRRLCTT